MVLHYEAPASDHEIHDDLFFTLPIPILALVANVTMLITTTVFELACWQEVKKFYAKNPKLYLSAWWTNVVTISIMNVATYIVLATYLVDKTPNTMYQCALKFVGMILTHNVWYNHAHRASMKSRGSIGCARTITSSITLFYQVQQMLCLFGSTVLHMLSPFSWLVGC